MHARERLQPTARRGNNEPCSIIMKEREASARYTGYLHYVRKCKGISGVTKYPQSPEDSDPLFCYMFCVQNLMIIKAIDPQHQLSRIALSQPR